MSDMAKEARAAMKAKASRLTAADPHQKVDSSTWTPPEALNTEAKTGLRPISRRAFKKGGKVMGTKPAANLGKATRGGNKPITPDNFANKDVKAANEDRAGIKHVGALKRGGKAMRKGRDLGGPTIGYQGAKQQSGKDFMPLDEAMWIEQQKAGWEDPTQNKGQGPTRKAAERGELQRKSGGRAKKQAGGVPLPPRRPDSLGKIPAPAPSPEDAPISPAMRARMQGIVDRDAAANRAYEAGETARRDYEVTGQKRGGKVAKCWGGKAKKADGGALAGAQAMMKRAQQTAGVPASTLDSAPTTSRLSKVTGLKKGGAAKHDDAKADMALIKKMVKPEARKGKEGGGALGALGGIIPMLLEKKNGGRTARKEGGGVFTGPGYPGKIPGVVPGGRTAHAAGGKAGKGKTNINIVVAAGKHGEPDMGANPMGGPTRPPGGMPISVPPPQAAPPAGAMPMPIPMPMPGGMPPGAPPAPRKSGGRLTKVASSYKDMEAGAAGGEGRLQKTDIAKKHKDAPAFKKGGKVFRSYKDMDAGSGSGMGRLEKTEIQSHKR